MWVQRELSPSINGRLLKKSDGHSSLCAYFILPVLFTGSSVTNINRDKMSIIKKPNLSLISLIHLPKNGEIKLCSNNEIDVQIVNERPTYLSETVFIIAVFIYILIDEIE